MSSIPINTLDNTTTSPKNANEKGTPKFDNTLNIEATLYYHSWCNVTLGRLILTLDWNYMRTLTRIEVNAWVEQCYGIEEVDG